MHKKIGVVLVIVGFGVLEEVKTQELEEASASLRRELDPCGLTPMVNTLI